jgi:hypothetical protein
MAKAWAEKTRKTKATQAVKNALDEAQGACKKKGLQVILL